MQLLPHSVVDITCMVNNVALLGCSVTQCKQQEDRKKCELRNDLQKALIFLETGERF